MTDEQYNELNERDKSLLHAIENEEYADALDYSQKVIMIYFEMGPFPICHSQIVNWSILTKNVKFCLKYEENF